MGQLLLLAVYYLLFFRFSDFSVLAMKKEHIVLMVKFMMKVEPGLAMTVMSVLPQIDDALSPIHDRISSFKLNQGKIPYFSEGSYSVTKHEVRIHSVFAEL